MVDIRLRETAYMKAWGVFFAVLVVWYFAGPYAVGIVLLPLLASARAFPDAITVLLVTAFLVASIPVTYLAFRWSVRRYVVPEAVDEAASAPPPDNVVRIG